MFLVVLAYAKTDRTIFSPPAPVFLKIFRIFLGGGQNRHFCFQKVGTWTSEAFPKRFSALNHVKIPTLQHY